MRLALSIGVAATAVLASGCALGPHAGGRSVTHDVARYFEREWPLDGRASATSACQGCSGGVSGCNAGPTVWTDDWDQPGCLTPGKGYAPDPPPAVPLEAGAPGRFFPVPTHEPFKPQGPSTVGFGPIVKAEG